MGTSVWLYLWLLDKMTSISEQGIGKVLGGRPIKFDEVQLELGISDKTYRRWVSILKGAGYINVKHAPYGLLITVNKASKVFGNKIRPATYDRPVKNKGRTKMTDPDRPHMTDLADKNDRPNKTIQLDNTNNKTTPKPPAFGEEDIKLTEMLFNKIQRNFVELGVKRDRKPATDKDYLEMNRLHRLDGYAYDQISNVINWCQNDSFWKQNILSVPTLRQQFEKLLMKSQAGRFKAPPPSEKDQPGWRPNRAVGSGSMASIGAIINNH